MAAVRQGRWHERQHYGAGARARLRDLAHGARVGAEKVDMCIAMYLSIYKSIYLSVYLSIYIYTSIHLYIYTSIYLCLYLHI